MRAGQLLILACCVGFLCGLLAIEFFQMIILFGSQLSEFRDVDNKSSEAHFVRTSALPYSADNNILPSIKVHQNSNSFQVEWVFILHVSGDLARYEAVTSSWFRPTAPNLGLVLIGGESITLAREDQEYVLISPARTGAFDTTKQAFATAAQTFPSARFFAKFDDETYVYTKELVRQVEASSNQSAYWGYPVRYESFEFASGGAGYVLSASSVKALLRCDEFLIPYEDVAVGACMIRSGFNLHYLVGLHPHHPFQMLRWDKNGPPANFINSRAPLEGYMNPLSYHFISPSVMLRMHDEVYLHGTADHRSRIIPRIIHQFWEGEDGKPELMLHKCKDVHPGWEHIVWDDDLVRKHFPSNENSSDPSRVDGVHTGSVNQDIYDSFQDKNLLKDIVRYEILMLFGGMYLDAGIECFRPIDHLLLEKMGDSQGFVFQKDGQYEGGLAADGVIGTYAFSPLSILLVATIQDNDTHWSQPPEISAGPLHLAKTLSHFRRISPAYWRVLILDYVYICPFHNDIQPNDLTQAIVDKGALMDSAIDKHKNRKWSEQALETLTLPTATNTTWLDSYAKNVHALGLSALAIHKPRWVVADLDPLAGTCNRIMHILSSFAFALATGRVLLLDWQDTALQTHVNGKENIVQSDFTKLFSTAPFRYSYQEAMARFRFDEGHHHIHIQDTDFLRHLRFSDLDQVYKQPILHIHRVDWWAPPLMHNKLYSGYVFEGRSSATVFSELFHYFFRPNKPQTPLVACDWFVHIRTVWERQTAPKEAFVRCATEHDSSTGNVNDRMIISTDSQSQSETIGTTLRGCRNSLECNEQAVQAMYQLAGNCKRAVLTATSTFGACIAGIGMMSETYTVTPDGECHIRKFTDPIDAGTLPDERSWISELILPALENEITNIVYSFVFSSFPNDTEVREFQRTVCTLKYPLVLFVPKGTEETWRYLQFITSTRIYVAPEPYDPEHPVLTRYGKVIPL